MQYSRLFSLATIIAIFIVAHFDTAFGGSQKNEDTIIIGGEHGCGPKLVYKGGGKKKGDIILMNDCKKKKTHYIPYPVYHGGYEEHGGGYGGGY
ncbi:hypothetical protein DERP_004463 [Dermatophagoides pteronyssinus]|uniref:Uncharacterized protein LOC113792854 n=2 Tax=Dermatophagoides pteronyssinus TaxID=6956 RepID=A0A6P6Y013_DERPT|nr:uncharacterized protein LOC113792854 [Dermatophagoides pteronyssinus]KAH9424281.1 hypothetical protein DERP_004463 [Dermatophagoides pteronyssinus]